MKPILRVIIAAVFTLMLVSCASETDLKKYVESLQKSEYTDLADTGITMSLKDEAVTTKTESLTIEYANATDIEYVFGKEPHMEIASDAGWYVIPIDEDAGWEDIGFILPPHGTSEKDFPLGYYYTGLMPGHYRIIKTFYADGNRVAAAVEFDIQ